MNIEHYPMHTSISASPTRRCFIFHKNYVTGIGCLNRLLLVDLTKYIEEKHLRLPAIRKHEEEVSLHRQCNFLKL